MSEDTGCAECFLCALFLTVVKPISDLRLLTSGLCSLLFALISASALLLGLTVPAEAQLQKRVPRVGILLPWSPASAVSLSFLQAFRKGLHELSYTEGQNLSIDSRYSDGVSKRFPKLALELVGLKVDVIVTTAGRPALAAKEATTTIPIVFTQVADPVAEGLVASLARPGGNITGLSQIGPELAGKRLELLQEAFPKISRVAVLGTLRSAGSQLRFKEMQAAAQAMGVELQQLEVHGSGDFEDVFRAAITGQAGALIVVQNALINTHRKRIIELAAKNQLPTMFEEKTHVEVGGLMSYGPSYFDLQRRAATYIDKILKGAKPADLPVERPRKFELVINLRTAKQIGVTIAPNVLVRADRVIQ